MTASKNAAFNARVLNVQSVQQAEPQVAKGNYRQKPGSITMPPGFIASKTGTAVEILDRFGLGD